MPGHGNKQDRKCEAAVAALLAQATVEKTAERAGIAYSTLKRWLKDVKFQETFRAARKELVSTSVLHLQRTMTQAMGTLYRNLSCGEASVEVRAALGILDQGFRGTEVLDLAAEVAELRYQLEELKLGPEKRPEPGPERNGQAPGSPRLYS
jgi:hypothetical protein